MIISYTNKVSYRSCSYLRFLKQLNKCFNLYYRYTNYRVNQLRGFR